MLNIINHVVRANEANSKISEGDYFDENGRLFCGKCNEPKQTVDVFPLVKPPRRMFIPCRCD